MGSGNLTPLEELKSLDQQIEQIETLSGLQPLFARLEEITKQYSSDFEVQLVAHDVKQHMLIRGSQIKALQPAPPPVVAPAPAAPDVTSAHVVVPPLAQPAPADEAKLTKPRRSKALVWVFASLVILAGIVIGVNTMNERNREIAATTPVDAGITTEPAGADVQINGQQTCKSDCIAKLAPGTYQVSATLEGYEAATGALVVEAGKPATLKLTLAPQAPSVRIFADLSKGQVFLDDQPAGELLDGQFTLEKVAPGTHTVKVTGGTSEASFSFSIPPSALPTVDGPIQTKNLLAVMVSHLGGKARMVTSSGPLKLKVNGQPEADATPAGVDLASFQPGAGEFVLGEGPTQKTLTGTFGTAPTLTAFLKTDQKIGTLIVATGQDDVRIFIDNKEQKRRTAKGLARIQTFGDVTVRVEKPGFEPVAPQTAKVTQGAETRLSFTLKEVPKFSAISVSAAAGTQVFVSDRLLGTVAGDGPLRAINIVPGEHSIELRRDQYEPKRFTRTFRAGETVVIGATEATLAAIPPPPPPPPAAPPKPEPAPVKAAAPKPRSGTIANFDNPGAWQEVEGVWRHRGAATLTYGIPPNGIFTFSIYMLKGGGLFGGGKVRWVLNYVDAKNYSLFELDEENFWSKVVVNGKTMERKKVAHKQDKSMRVWNIQIDSTAAKLTTKIQGDANWVDLDSWTEPGRDFTKGKFGILVNGTDEVGLSNFAFTGR